MKNINKLSLQEIISDDIKKAMIAKEKDKLNSLRSVKAAFILEMAKDGSDVVSDEIAVNIIRKLVKQRNESASIFVKQGRDDLAKDELGKHSIGFGIYGIPESILINNNLIIIKKFVGPLNENDLNLIKETINSK